MFLCRKPKPLRGPLLWTVRRLMLCLCLAAFCQTHWPFDSQPDVHCTGNKRLRGGHASNPYQIRASSRQGGACPTARTALTMQGSGCGSHLVDLPPVCSGCGAAAGEGLLSAPRWCMAPGSAWHAEREGPDRIFLWSSCPGDATYLVTGAPLLPPAGSAALLPRARAPARKAHSHDT